MTEFSATAIDVVKKRGVDQVDQGPELQQDRDFADHQAAARNHQAHQRMFGVSGEKVILGPAGGPNGLRENLPKPNPG